MLATGQPTDMFSGRLVPLGSTVALVGAGRVVLHTCVRCSCVVRHMHVPLGTSVALGGTACWCMGAVCRASARSCCAAARGDQCYTLRKSRASMTGPRHSDGLMVRRHEPTRLETRGKTRQRTRGVHGTCACCVPCSYQCTRAPMRTVPLLILSFLIMLEADCRHDVHLLASRR